jgi:hypothetical protein
VRLRGDFVFSTLRFGGGPGSSLASSMGGFSYGAFTSPFGCNFWMSHIPLFAMFF